MNCKYCGEVIPQGRADLGKDYCMSKSCLNAHEKEWAEGYRVVLVPKQGFTYVQSDDPFLMSGRSSGRT